MSNNVALVRKKIRQAANLGWGQLRIRSFVILYSAMPELLMLFREKATAISDFYK